MNYTILTLAGLGVLGILLHNLIKLNELNRASEGTINIGKYWSLERFSIAISIVVVIIGLIARTEIALFEKLGNWLGLTFVTLGYMAQSIVVAFMGKAQKYISDKEGK